jgi:hypothetical protein
LPRTLALSQTLAKEQQPGDRGGLLGNLFVTLWDETVDPPAPARAAMSAQQVVRRRLSRTTDVAMWKLKEINVWESIQVGLTKVFLRKQAHDILESRRSRRMLVAAKKIQSSFRSYTLRSYFVAPRFAIYISPPSHPRGKHIPSPAAFHSRGRWGCLPREWEAAGEGRCCREDGRLLVRVCACRGDGRLLGWLGWPWS